MQYAEWDDIDSGSRAGGGGEDCGWALAVGAATYALMLLVTSVVFERRFRAREIACHSVSTAFYALLTFFLAVRIAWWVVQLMEVSTVADVVLNRVALCVFLLAFTSVLSYWADTVHTTRTLVYTFTVAGLVVVTTFVLGTVGAVIYTHDFGDNILYKANVMCISSFFLLFAVGFLIYGLCLYHRIKSTKRSGRSKVLNCAILCFTCFTARFVLFFLDLWSFFAISRCGMLIFAYVVPELLPSLLFLWVMNKPAFEHENERDPLLGSGSGIPPGLYRQCIRSFARSHSIQRDDWGDGREEYYPYARQ
eukprot:m51a1_g5695 hypothetical protein (307) ;mRNA; f:1011043-1012333